MTTRTLHLAQDLALPLDAVTQTFAILGKRGSGKTTTATVLTEELLEAGQPVVVIDPLDVTWGLRSSRDGKKPGYPITVLGGDHADLPLEASAGAVLAEFVVESHAPIILSLRHFSLNDQRRFVTDFAERLYVLKGKQTNRAALHLVIDECDEFAHQRIPAGHERLFGAIDRLVRRGRSAGIGVTMISQRPAVIHKDILSQAEVLVCHQTISPQDRKALEAWIEAHDAHGQRAEFMNTLAGLQRGEAWVWSPGWLNVFQRVTIRDRRTFDSSSTPKAGEQQVAPKQLATVDLAQLETRMAGTVAKAKADDPRESKRLLAQASKEIADRDRRINELQATEARASGFARSPEKAQQEARPVLTDTDRVHVDKLAQSILDGAAMMHRDLVDAGARLQSALDSSVQTYVQLVQAVTAKAEALLRAELDRPRIATVLEKIRQITPPTTTATAPRSPLVGRVAPASAPATRRRPAHQVSHGSGDTSLGRAERALLTAAVQRLPKSVSRAQLSVLSGYSIKSSSFSNALGALRSKGLMTGSGDDNRVTDAGVVAVGDCEPLPTGRALVEHWMGQLGKAERALLDVFVQRFPSEVSKADLSATSGYSETSSSFSNALGRLRSLELVNGLRASEELFV